MLHVKVVVSQNPPLISVGAKADLKTNNVFADHYAEEIFYQITDGTIATYQSLGVKIMSPPISKLSFREEQFQLDTNSPLVNCCTGCWGIPDDELGSKTAHGLHKVPLGPVAEDKIVEFQLDLSELCSRARTRHKMKKPTDPLCEIRATNIDLSVISNLLKHKETILAHNWLHVIEKSQRRAYYRLVPPNVSAIVYQEEREHVGSMISMTRLKVKFYPGQNPSVLLGINVGSKKRNGGITCRHIPHISKQVTSGLVEAYKQLGLDHHILKATMNKKSDGKPIERKTNHMIKFTIDISKFWERVTPLYIYDGHSEADFAREIDGLELPEKVLEEVLKRKQRLLNSHGHKSTQTRKICHSKESREKKENQGELFDRLPVFADFEGEKGAKNEQCDAELRNVLFDFLAQFEPRKCAHTKLEAKDLNVTFQQELTAIPMSEESLRDLFLRVVQVSHKSSQT